MMVIGVENVRQKKRDLDRQNKIITALNPKRFWRYNSVTKAYSQIISEKVIINMES